MSRLLVCAGPNGSGKSTLTAYLPTVGEIVNADEIQRHLGCSALEAAQNAERVREDLLARRADFTMETVLSTPRNLLLMRRARAAGYEVLCWYLLTADPEINVRRVRARAAKGQHDVPEDKVRSRYIRALEQLPEVLPACDEAYVFDNSREREAGGPSLILRWEQGALTSYPNELWPQERLDALAAGRYPAEYLGRNS